MPEGVIDNVEREEDVMKDCPGDEDHIVFVVVVEMGPLVV